MIEDVRKFEAERGRGEVKIGFLPVRSSLLPHERTSRAVVKHRSRILSNVSEPGLFEYMIPSALRPDTKSLLSLMQLVSADPWTRIMAFLT